MPPIRSQPSRNSIEQEGMILLAIQAIKNQEISAIRKAARRFNVPETSLRRRLRGAQNRAISHANSHKLTEIKESLFENGFSYSMIAEQPPGLLPYEKLRIFFSRREDLPRFKQSGEDRFIIS